MAMNILATHECWDLVLAAAAGDRSQRVEAALRQLQLNRLPAEAFTPDRASALIRLLLLHNNNQPFSSTSTSAAALAASLLSRCALLYSSSSSSSCLSSSGAPEASGPWWPTLAPEAAEASLRLLEASFSSFSSSSSGQTPPPALLETSEALRCAGACAHGLPPNEAAALADRCLSCLEQRRPGPSPGVVSTGASPPSSATAAASGLAHLAVSAARAPPHVAASHAGRAFAALLRLFAGESCSAGGGAREEMEMEAAAAVGVPLVDLTSLAQRAGEALLLEPPQPGAFLEEGWAGGGGGGGRTGLPINARPSGDALWAAAAEGCMIGSSSEDGGGSWVMEAVRVAVAGGLLRALGGAAGGGGDFSTLVASGGPAQTLQAQVLQPAAEAASSAHGRRGRLLRIAVTCALVGTGGPPLHPSSSSLSPAAASCLVSVLLNERLGVAAALEEAAAGRSSPEAMAKSLSEASWASSSFVPATHGLLGAAVREIRRVTAAGPESATETAVAVQGALRPWASALHSGYCRYVDAAAAAAGSESWLDPAGPVAGALRGATGDAFAAAVALLAPLDAAGSLESAEALGVLACLEFARVPLGAHGRLVASAMASAAEDPKQAAQLLRILKSEADPVLMGTDEASGPVRASRALLLMIASAAAVRSVAVASCWTPWELADAAAPVASAYLLAPDRPGRRRLQPLRDASMTLLGGLLRALVDSSSTRRGGMKEDTGVLEAVASLLARGTVASFPSAASIQQLGTAAALLLDSSPPGSPLRPWLVRRLAARAAEVAREQSSPVGEAAEEATEKLLQLMAECLLKAGAQVQGAAMQGVREELLLCLHGSHEQPQVVAAALNALHTAIQASDDCVLKVEWVRWYQRLAAESLRGPRRTTSSSPSHGRQLQGPIPDTAASAVAHPF